MISSELHAKSHGSDQAHRTAADSLIKLIIFDLDGVLVDSKDLHFVALNKALESIDTKYIISMDHHLTQYDGLPTRRKLEILSATRGLPLELHDTICAKKQEATVQAIAEVFKPDPEKIKILKDLKANGFQIHVASNSIRETVRLMLLHSGLLEYVDYYISNQDVKRPKPSTEMFLKCMLLADRGPQETLIVEDSQIGRIAANKSGAHVCAVTSCEDVSEDRIWQAVNFANKTAQKSTKWVQENLNILIPMAGLGSRFQQAGYQFPKPLIDIHGKPMIQWVVENLNINANYIFLCQKEHCEKYQLNYLLNLMTDDHCKIVEVDKLTEGAACTTLLARDHINNDNPLLIVNSDQYILWDSSDFFYSVFTEKLDGAILTFEDTHPKWSFAKLNDQGYVSQVAEKQPISNLATVGVYYWRKGSDYVKYAEQMIEKNIRVNNEFYVCPVFNEAIGDEKKFRTFNVEKMWGLGDPESMETFIEKSGIYAP